MFINMREGSRIEIDWGCDFVHGCELEKERRLEPPVNPTLLYIIQHIA